MYKISYPSGTILKDGVPVPMVESDPAYQSYLSWLMAGGTLEPVNDVAPPRRRIIVSAWQIRKALNALGLRENVESAVAAANNITLRDGWEYSPNFFSDEPLTMMLGASLNKTPDEIYQIFQMAEGL